MNIITRILVYDASYAVGFLLMLLLTLLLCKRFGCSRPRAVFYSVFTFLSGFAGAWLVGKIYNFLASLKGIEIHIIVDVLGAVSFISPFLLAAVNIEKLIIKKKNEKKLAVGIDSPARTVSFRDTMDMMTPGSFLVFASIKLGCFFRGCCYGVESSWGVTYQKGGVTLFPVQIFECATICLILVVCFFLKQTPLYRRGMAGPLTVFLYACSRFLWEFKRYYTPEMRHFLFGLSLWQLISILAILITVIWLAVLFKTQPSEPQPKSNRQLSAEEFLFGAKTKKNN